MTITVNVQGLDGAIRRLAALSRSLDDYAHEIVNRLSLIGYDVAYQIMGEHVYSGETIGSLTIVENDPTHFTLMASSVALLFFEFGAGLGGYGHPLAGQFHMGPGTYPGQTHALDPNGWWYPTNDPALIILRNNDPDAEFAGWGHSYGNPPHMPMYSASQKMKEDLLTVAREVFAGD